MSPCKQIININFEIRRTPSTQWCGRAVRHKSQGDSRCDGSQSSGFFHSRAGRFRHPRWWLRTQDR